jgi:nucleotide-binding universal stress UspA family protein
MALAVIMVHVDIERDSEQRIQVALRLADRFGAALIGIAGSEPQPVFAAGDIAVFTEPDRSDTERMALRLDQLGKKFCQQGARLRHVEWRSSLSPAAYLLIRQARAADLILVGSRHRAANASGLVDPGVILLRTGRPVLVVPDTVAPFELHRTLVAWKDTRECRRAVRDAIPLLQKSREVLLLGLREDGTDLEPKEALADVSNYLRRHEVGIASQNWRPSRGPVAGELLQIVRDEGIDLVVAGGYGHSRLGEWMFGGVTHELLGRSPVCCMLSH